MGCGIKKMGSSSGKGKSGLGFLITMGMGKGGKTPMKNSPPMKSGGRKRSGMRGK